MSDLIFSSIPTATEIIEAQNNMQRLIAEAYKCEFANAIKNACDRLKSINTGCGPIGTSVPVYLEKHLNVDHTDSNGNRITKIILLRSVHYDASSKSSDRNNPLVGVFQEIQEQMLQKGLYLREITGSSELNIILSIVPK